MKAHLACNPMKLRLSASNYLPTTHSSVLHIVAELRWLDNAG